jgi:hypothetical protein
MGSEGHNTIQFDDHDQMPKISRFLYGAWLESDEVTPVCEREDGSLEWSAAYTDWCGAKHKRAIVVSPETCKVVDRVSNFESKAVLRWHLAPGEWTINKNTLFGLGVRLELKSNTEFVRLKIVEAESSLYYGLSELGPVLEAEIASPATVVTTVSWPLTPLSDPSKQ